MVIKNQGDPLLKYSEGLQVARETICILNERTDTIKIELDELKGKLGIVEPIAIRNQERILILMSDKDRFSNRMFQILVVVFSSIFSGLVTSFFVWQGLK